MPQICPGDVLVSINESNAIGLHHSKIVHMVRGAAGTHVELGFHRPGNPAHRYIVNLVRAHERPVSQRAFGTGIDSPEQRGVYASRTSRTFLVM
jgi:C-terminal processing protease CtpA/Prc